MLVDHAGAVLQLLPHDILVFSCTPPSSIHSRPLGLALLAPFCLRAVNFSASYFLLPVHSIPLCPAAGQWIRPFCPVSGFGCFARSADSVVSCCLVCVFSRFARSADSAVSCCPVVGFNRFAGLADSLFAWWADSVVSYVSVCMHAAFYRYGCGPPGLPISTAQ